MPRKPGKAVRLFVNGTDRHRGKPLYEAIVARGQELKLAGIRANHVEFTVISKTHSC